MFWQVFNLDFGDFLIKVLVKILLKFDEIRYLWLKNPLNFF